MPLSRFKTVVILCPYAKTGGPEAIHQAAFALNSLGVTCYLAYVGADHRTGFAPGKLFYESSSRPTLLDIYAHYNPRLAAEVPLGPDTLVVFPEAFVQHIGRRPNHGAAMWWLSVDNAFRVLPELADLETRQRHFADPSIIHLYQSAYARDWLRGSGFQTILELGDFTSDEFTAREAYGPSPRPTAAYNAAKGADLAEGFFAQRPQYEALPLRKFSKPELRAIFGERLLYVDFGHFPGKDRLPREAAISGSVVFVNRAGAGASYEDFPLPEIFKFEPADVESGELDRRMQAVVAEPGRYWDMQADFRSRVRWEKAQFFDNIMRLWGMRRMP